jgi:hypothetical protein
MRAKASVAGQRVLFHLAPWGEDLIFHLFREGERRDFDRIILPTHQSVPARAKNRKGVFGHGDIQI